MQITIDTTVDSPQAIRDACGLLLIAIGVLPREDAAPLPPPSPFEKIFGDVPSASGDAPAAGSTPPPPPPPPPAPVAGAAPAGAVPPPPLASVPTLAPAVGGTAPAPTGTTPANGATASQSSTPSAETSLFDSAGLRWDERIHQSGKGRKKDGTWKIKKNCDPTLVQAVVKELTAGRVAAPPPAPLQLDVEIPPPPPVLLPPGSTGSLPVPAVNTGTTAATVSVAGAPTPVPVSLSAAAGAVPSPRVGPTFRDLVTKFGAATRENRIRPEEVGTICGAAGAPNLMSLAATPELIAKVDELLDARLLQP